MLGSPRVVVAQQKRSHAHSIALPARGSPPDCGVPSCRGRGLWPSASGEEPSSLRPLWGLMGGRAPTAFTRLAVPHWPSEGSPVLPPALLCLATICEIRAPGGDRIRFLGGLPSTANHCLNQLSSLIKLTDGRKRVLGWCICLAVMLQHRERTYRIEREVAHAERQACHGHFGQRPGRNAMTRPFQVREQYIKRPGVVRGALPWFCRCGHGG